MPPGAPQAKPGADATQESNGTTHLSVVDRWGNAVALTSSIETGFGSGLMAGGFLLNNQLTDFSFRPRDDNGKPIANAAGPGKRPRSSMAPTMIFDPAGRLLAVLGSPGGPRIPLYVVKTVVGADRLAARCAGRRSTCRTSAAATDRSRSSVSSAAR